MQQIDIYKLIKAYRRLNDRCEFILAITPNRDEWWQLNCKIQKLYDQCKKINAEDKQKINEYLEILNKLVDKFNYLKMKNNA